MRGLTSKQKEKMYPPVNKQFAIENGTFIVDLPIKKM